MILRQQEDILNHNQTYLTQMWLIVNDSLFSMKDKEEQSIQIIKKRSSKEEIQIIEKYKLKNISLKRVVQVSLEI